MKEPVVAIGLSLAMIAAHAQNTPSAGPPDLSKATKVAGGNRTSSAQLAAGGKAGSSGGTVASRPMWVDASGKAWAAYDGSAAILVLNGKTTYLSGLSPTCASMAGPPYCEGQTTNAGAATWAPWVGAYYATEDCTGQAYISGFAAGFAQFAAPITDGTDNQTYLYVGDSTQLASLVVRSTYANRQCFAQPPTTLGSMSPVVAVVPAATIATPPFAVK